MSYAKLYLRMISRREPFALSRFLASSPHSTLVRARVHKQNDGKER